MKPGKGISVRPSNQWLSDSAFNLLIDYYTEVQFRPYGSGAIPQNVVPFLKQLKLGYLCIYAKGHSGYTSWPSSLKTQHNMLGQDMPKVFRQMTRQAGTRLVLYYSGLMDGIAGERHPEWRQWNLEGKPCDPWFTDFKCFISHPICPLSPYWDEWVSIHLRELITQYDPDGIWVDGDWPGPCYCPRCQQRLRADTGWKEPWSDLVKRTDFSSAYAKTWNRITHGWRIRFSRYVRKLKPSCLYSAGNVSPRREFLAPFDWRSGDFFSPGFFNLHDMARMMRWYSTLGVPYDAYVCDTSFTHVRKAVRSRSKSLDRMLQEAATVASNGAAVGYWTFPLGNGAFVPSRMRKAVAVRRFVAEREDVFLHTQSAAWTAIAVTDPSTPTFGRASVEGAHKAMAALHRSPDIMDETGVSARMPHDLVVIPEQEFVDRKTALALASYVRRGGRLLTTGATIRSSEIRSLLGVKEVRFGAVNDGHVLLKTHDEPTGVDSAWDRLDLNGAKELYPLYLSWDQFNSELRNMMNNYPMHGQLDEEHPEHAGFAAAVMRRVGKGVIVHIATNIFSQYRQLGDPQMLRWLKEIVEFLDPQPRFQTDAPSWVDVSLRRKGNELLIHVVNQNPGRDISRIQTDDTWVDEIPEVGPYSFRLRCPRKPGKATWEPGNRPAESEWRRGILNVVLPSVRIHACLRVSRWPFS
jgi:hypothetical protein